MNKFYLLAILFFALGVFSVSAQDMIVLTDGNMVEAKVEEITPTEIKYRRSNNLGGPLITINKSDVFSIKYENGTVETFNVAPASSAPPASAPPASAPAVASAVERRIPAVRSTEPVLDPDTFYFGFSVEPAGFLAGGPSATAEFSKGAFNSTVFVNFPTLALRSQAEGFGVGLGVSANHVWQSRIGGFYLGAMLGWNAFPYLATVTHPYYSYNVASDSYTSQDILEETTAHNFILALNAGYRFVTASRIYFRTGISLGVSFSTHLPLGFYYKPDLAAGYVF
ncbi:MAG: hypothetical protein LBI06_02250 [Treponema sp.]|jgi:hypothetical protein|nr:hypothetical protein [Treponema sp.]